jgi:methionine-rich copper-binding protein CopC
MSSPACAPPAHSVDDHSASILESSRPAAGSTVVGSVNELVLHFDPPARLDEVTVTGRDGPMPMMVHAVGERTTYWLPLLELGAGSHEVNWRASVQGREYRGTFQFSVQD